jgi:hypothetical protein
VFSLTLSAPTLPALISALKEAAQSSIDPAPTALTSAPEVLGEPEQAGLAKAPRKKKDLTPPGDLAAKPTAASTAEPTAALLPPPSALAPPAPAPSSITLIGLRSQLLELSDAGHRPAVRDLLKQFGVERLTDLPVTEYEAFALQATGLAQST